MLAARNGRLEVLRWLKDEGLFRDEGICSEAVGGFAGGYHLEVLRWARAQGCS